MVSRLLIVAFLYLLAQVGAGCVRSSNHASVSSAFSPDRWSQPDRDRYLALQGLSDNDAVKRVDKVAVGSKGMIAGTSEPFAVHAGLEVLKHGGGAADAALTTVLAACAVRPDDGRG